MEQLPQKRAETPQKTTSITTLIREKSNGVRIRDMVNTVPLKQSLSYAYKMTDLKVDNFPKGLDDQILIDFIIGAYGGLCGAEIKLAFKLGCKGDLNVEMNHYQAFTPIYLGRVLKAYTEFRQKELAKHPKSILHTVKEEPIDRAKYYQDKLFTPFEELKKGRYLFNDIDEIYLYRSLDSMGIVMATTEEKIEAMKEAEKLEPTKYRENPEDRKVKVKQRAKRMCFRNWIENQALEDNNIKQQVIEKL